MSENLLHPPGHVRPEVTPEHVPPRSKGPLGGLTGELILELFGSFVIGIFGFGVAAQVTVGKGALGGHDSIVWAWGLGVTFGILVAGKVTGAHLNPAVTLTVAVFRGFSWVKAGPYVVAQVIGWFLGALVIRANYASSLAAIDPHHTYVTQGVFSTLPGNGNDALNVTIGNAFLDQVLGTGMLLFLIFAITDPRNSNPSLVVVSVAVGLVIVAIGFALGTNAGYAINPARDFGPRLMEWLTGWRDAWTDQHGTPYWWVPVLGPLVGGVVGGAVYQFTCGLTLKHSVGDPVG